MAWAGIPNKPLWEYDTAPADPGATSPYYPLWLKQTAGIRTTHNGAEIYTKCRPIGSTKDTHGEINKSHLSQE